MTRLATMGTSSCATIAIAGWKDNHEQMEKNYLADPSSFKEPQGLSVDQFYSQIIYPTSQPLGHTKEYPFSLLMKKLDESKLKTKFVIATLNSYQVKSSFWTDKLKAHGFIKIDETNNTIGTRNHIFIRNPNRPETCAVPNELV